MSSSAVVNISKWRYVTDVMDVHSVEHIMAQSINGSFQSHLYSKKRKCMFAYSFAKFCVSCRFLFVFILHLFIKNHFKGMGIGVNDVEMFCGLQQAITSILIKYITNVLLPPCLFSVSEPLIIAITLLMFKNEYTLYI